MMYNPDVLRTLPELPKGQVWLTLTHLNDTYRFLINPDTVQVRNQAEYSQLPVLNTTQPLYKFKYSEGVLTFPKVLFWTPGDNNDISDITTKLAHWCRQSSTLDLAYGWLRETIKLKSYTVTYTQFRDGKPTKAEGSLECFFTPKLPISKPDLTVKLTQRELKRSNKR